MADVPNATSNVTLYDELGNPVQVSLNALSGIYELRTKDKDVYDILQNPSVDSAPDLWQYLTNLGNGFSASTGFITTSGSAEIDFLLFRNPAGSGKTVKFHQTAYTYTKGSGVSIAKLYISPTITAVGTPLAVNKRYIGHATAPVSLVYSAPTIAARGTFIRLFGQGATGTLVNDQELGFIMPAGYDLLVTITPAANNTDHAIYQDWAEVVP